MNKIIAVKKDGKLLANLSLTLCVFLNFITFSAYCGAGHFEYLEVNSKTPSYFSYAVVILAVFALFGFIFYKDYLIGERRRFKVALKSAFFQIFRFAFVITFVISILYSLFDVMLLAPLWISLILLFIFVLVIVYFLNHLNVFKEDKKNVESN